MIELLKQNLFYYTHTKIYLLNKVKNYQTMDKEFFLIYYQEHLKLKYLQ